MPLRALAAALFASSALLGAPAGAWAQGFFGEFAEGQCGAPYVGQDRNAYPCSKIRKPVCQRDTGRCQCLERRECGGKQDESW
ncbi:hypothetical protein [Methylocella sp.]|uniref:hypothetical protein n=1 Tax=Methylocella sp. TaxID=1978226 RepID=UPI0037847A0E